MQLVAEKDMYSESSSHEPAYSFRTSQSANVSTQSVQNPHSDHGVSSGSSVSTERFCLPNKCSGMEYEVTSSSSPLGGSAVEKTCETNRCETMIKQLNVLS